MDKLGPAKVLVAGSVNGNLAGFFEKIKKLDAKYGPFSVLLIIGNLFGNGSDAGEVDALLKNELSVPIMTYAVAGDRMLPRRVQERASAKSGEVCTNLVVLSGHGILQTSEGIKIAYIGGRDMSQSQSQSQSLVSDKEANKSTEMESVSSDIGADHENTKSDTDGESTQALKGNIFSNEDVVDLISQASAENEKAFQKTIAQPSIDILLTPDWPFGVVSRDKAQPDMQVMDAKWASNKVSYLSASIMPRYHFAAGEEVFYERLPWKYSDRVQVGQGSNASCHFTRFIGLGAVNGGSSKTKQRWFYAMNVMPLQLVTQGKAAPAETPSNCTPNPLYRFGRLRAGLSSGDLDRMLASVDSNPRSESGKSSSGPSHGRCPPPPLSYVCRNCNQPGHWIQDCPVESQNKRQRTNGSPPDGYVCHQCKKPGHWRADCTALDDKAQASDPSSKCWFCLANPDVDQNLMAAIGDEAYVAMAKGSLVVERSSATGGYQGHSSPIPGGGHVLIVPIAHKYSLRKAPAADGKDSELLLHTEIERWEQAISALFAEHSCVPLAFETCRNLPHVHTMVQMIPIPMSKAAVVKSTLEQICREDQLEIEHDYPQSPYDGYFRVKDPASNTALFVTIPAKSKSFNLQLGRKLAARILGVPQREDWKQCIVPSESEACGRDRFIAVFAKHDFTR
ncbi:hypothetical protein GGI12_002968 [Dipsacomyces acuminosporus]|nr:hypothetical protein GGI12_002968 [Dipsacomyces acuminosporus]